MERVQWRQTAFLERTAISTASPFVDARTPVVDEQPESRRYRARYRDDDDPVDDRSDIVEVTGASVTR